MIETKYCTIAEFQADFDALLDFVEQGGHVVITDDEGRKAVLIPYKEYESFK